MKTKCILTAVFLFFSTSTIAEENKKTSKNTVDELVAFQCGSIKSSDRSLWSPGVAVNVKHNMVASFI